MNFYISCRLKFYEKHLLGPFGVVMCVERKTERKMSEKSRQKWTISSHREVGFLHFLACLEANGLLYLVWVEI